MTAGEPIEGDPIPARDVRQEMRFVHRAVFDHLVGVFPDSPDPVLSDAAMNVVRIVSDFVHEGAGLLITKSAGRA